MSFVAQLLAEVAQEPEIRRGYGGDELGEPCCDAPGAARERMREASAEHRASERVGHAARALRGRAQEAFRLEAGEHGPRAASAALFARLVAVRPAERLQACRTERLEAR